MAIISTQISKNFFLSIQRDSYIDFKNHSLQLLLSSEIEAIQSIQKEIVFSNQKLTNKDPVLNQSYFFSNELATIQVDVFDASNCFNLNSIFIKTGDGLQIKKDNKELLSYLLFEMDDEDTYVKGIQSKMDIEFEAINTDSYFYMRKSIRKILRQVKKYIRYSQKKETEVELLIYFLEKFFLILKIFFLDTITQNPIPQLNVFNISSSEIFLVLSHLKIFVVLTLDRSILSVKFSGTDLIKFSIKPPPVI